MHTPRPAVGRRLLPAVLTAAGVTLLAAGLLDYGAAASATPDGRDPPSASAAGSDGPVGYLPPSLPPIDGSAPPPRPTTKPDPNRVATRIVIRTLGINLPVIEKVLNHTSGSFGGIVGVYQRHTFADEKRGALDLWANHIQKIVCSRGTT